MEQEKWVDVVIPGLDYKCQVSSIGQVKILAYDSVAKRNGTEYIVHHKERLCKIQNQKYQFVQLMINGKQRLCYVHRLVAEAFIPNPDNLPEVNHKNEDKYDNRVENLEWCTHSYNVSYGTRIERMKGTAIINGKWSNLSTMDEEELKEHRRMLSKRWYENHKEQHRQIQKRYNEEHKEHIKEYQKRYRELNKEALSAKKKKKYNKERRREYYLNNREKIIKKSLERYYRNKLN